MHNFSRHVARSPLYGPHEYTSTRRGILFDIIHEVALFVVRGSGNMKVIYCVLFFFIKQVLIYYFDLRQYYDVVVCFICHFLSVLTVIITFRYI